MAKAKQQKPKPHRQAKPPHSKKRGGKQNDNISEFRAQLDALGLKIIQVTSDGNCLFRALADQLDGNEDEHEKYRSMVVQFMRDHREDFEPFVEDEVTFDDYCRTMAEDATWAGNMELQAASRVTQSNICIHLHMQPRLCIRNFDDNDARMIHLSYHDGEHYNSVRLKEDSCAGPARPIVIQGDTNLPVPNRTKVVAERFKRERRGNIVLKESVKVVKAASGCKDDEKIEQVLQHADGDVDAAIEILIAGQGSTDEIVTDDVLPHSETNSNALNNFADENLEETAPQDKRIEDNSRKPGASGYDKENSQPVEKKISRNKACPCGSKKKYKSCCGTVSAKSSARFPVSNQTVDYGKNRKDRKQGRKSGSTTANSIQPDGGPPDMGALCI